MKLKFFPLIAILACGTLQAASSNGDAEKADSGSTTKVVGLKADTAKAENANLPEAPQSLVKDITADCSEWAVEDNIAKPDLNKYLLDCVNQELDVTGYKTVKKLG